MLDWAFDAGLSFGRRDLVYYWEASPGFSRMSFTHHVISSCNLLVNIKSLESTFLSLFAADEAAAS